MLILSRKSNESIIIGDNIRITVTSIRGRYVRIGIEAPEEVGIYREELCLDSAPTDEAIPAARDIRQRVQDNHDRRLLVSVGSREDHGATALSD
jgi:carbon storage regulator